MTDYRVCTLPGAYDGEWCRTYCLNYGTGRCRYDPESGKMIIKVKEGKE